MNTKDITDKCRDLIHLAKFLPLAGNEGYDRIHLDWMCSQIDKGKLTVLQTMWYLGWIQACLVIGGATTLKTIKEWCDDEK